MPGEIPRRNPGSCTGSIERSIGRGDRRAGRTRRPDCGGEFRFRKL